jgi:MYXO-CTERM domain-containing protein
MDATFDDFTSTAVPEPGVAAAAALLGLTLLQRRRPRRPD